MPEIANATLFYLKGNEMPVKRCIMFCMADPEISVIDSFLTAIIGVFSTDISTHS